MEKDFFEMLTEYFINERLGDILMKDERYVKLQNEAWEHIEQLEKNPDMDEGQYMAVKALLILHIRSIDLYAETAYEYGFRDCISIFRKLGLFKAL